jgi:hypothetical protein
MHRSIPNPDERPKRDVYAAKSPSGVPVYQMKSLNQFDRLEIEYSENQERKDFTPEEIEALKARLEKEGYKDSVSRPKRGEKNLLLPWHLYWVSQKEPYSGS